MKCLDFCRDFIILRIVRKLNSLFTICAMVENTPSLQNTFLFRNSSICYAAFLFTSLLSTLYLLY